MVEVYSNSLDELEKNIDALITLSENQKKQIARLNEENNNARNEILRSHAQIVELQKKYDSLKIAKANICLNKGDVKEAQKELSEIIEEINNCIAQLEQDEPASKTI
ncbi:MAG: hypothetical protein EOL95_04690 [Bacteroidia bacterium]|nr:hypothetical protein [Bacteroidia bacterium]